jgi:uncharacterized protein (DUF302 family)
MSHAELLSTTTNNALDAVVAALRAAVERRGITVSAVIDHAAAAEAVGQTIPGETVVTFGNPAVGTAVMAADPRAGLDLPLGVLIREAEAGTELLYLDPRRLGDEFDLSTVRLTLDALAEVLQSVVAEASA